MIYLANILPILSSSYCIKFYKETFQLQFGRPQIDTCVTFEDLGLNLRNSFLEEQKIRLDII